MAFKLATYKRNQRAKKAKATRAAQARNRLNSAMASGRLGVH